jgi:hypothetical protein
MAGALGHEKERGTLTALFATEMTAWQIIVGKLLGRLSQLLQPALVALPAIIFLAVVAEDDLHPVLLGLAQAAVLTFALASICLLAAVWTRRTSDAILGCYTVIALIVIANLSILADTPLPNWLDPFTSLSRLHGASKTPPDFLHHLAAWGAVGLGCLILAATRLRRVCLGQIEKRPGRWLWAFRPSVGNDPIRWRERYVIGLAPLPWLRGVPTWMALLGVFAFSAILAGSAIDSMARGFFPALRDLDFPRAWKSWQKPVSPDRVVGELSVMGATLLVVSSLVIGVRCGTSIAEEKRRNTLDDLLLTGRSIHWIIRSKRWGVLQAAVPYVIAYVIPMLLLASMGGPPGFIAACVWVSLTSAFMVAFSNIAVTIPEVADGPHRRKSPLLPVKRAREAIEPIRANSPVDGVVLLAEESPEMTEDEVIEFLQKEPPQ